MENKKENVYLISYWYKKSFLWLFTLVGVGRIEVSGDSVDDMGDIEQIEKGIMESQGFKKVVVLNCVKLS